MATELVPKSPLKSVKSVDLDCFKGFNILTVCSESVGDGGHSRRPEHSVFGERAR